MKRIPLILPLTENTFDSNPYWTKPIEDVSILLDPKNLELFDQNGYHMTKIEQEYAKANGYNPVSRREEFVIRKDWYQSNNPLVGPHLNHAELFQRKGFSEEAQKQLMAYVDENPLLWKLIKMKPKWGIDISIDYVDEMGNVFEIMHYEWDDFDYDVVLDKKLEMENIMDFQNWDARAKTILERKNEWVNLDFFEQSK